MDKTDEKILIFCRKRGQPIADIARKVGLSVPPIGGGLKLEEDGVIRARVALLKAKNRWACRCLWRSKLISIMPTAGGFAHTISQRKEVVEFYRMSGEVDYLLRVVVPDMAAYDRFYKDLIAE